MADTRNPSLFSSLFADTRGYIKGMFAGGGLGVAIGIIVGLAAGPGMWPLLAVACGAGFSAVGGALGLVTDVTAEREAKHNAAQTIEQIAQSSFAQGMAVGHQNAQAQEKELTVFRDRLAQEAKKVEKGATPAFH